MSLSAAPASHGQMYAWMYDVATSTWTDLGTVTVSGSTLSFGGSAANTTLRSGALYIVVPFTAGRGATCPTPTPPPPPPACSPSPAPSPTPTGRKLFVTTVCATATQSLSNAMVFDENGNPIATFAINGLALAFDPSNHLLYSGNVGTNTIEAFDENGNPVGTGGTFAGLNQPVGIAVDTANHELYVANFGASVTVYDENGVQIVPSGGFPGIPPFETTGIAFDSSARRIYVLLVHTVLVFDENGDPIAVSGTFPNLFDPQGIAFDSSNRRLYVTNNNATITVYDEDGNQDATSGAFPSLQAPEGIAFDAINSQLYVANALDAVTVYDQAGNQIGTSETFPGLHGASGIAVVP
ncbi:MAG: hypothetical protein JOZ38_07940 [Candidatus Eremiobacteraeota bacterium]|nr:hypothetical protein [Candidatus Eremiobacteraeota bacterium]